MGAILNRTTKEYRTTVSGPDFLDPPWLHDPDVKALILGGVPTKYWKINPDDTVVEMSDPEKDNEDLKTQTIILSSSAPADFDGVPAVDSDGSSIHTITVSKKGGSGKDVGAGSELLRPIISSLINVPTMKIDLSSGTSTFDIGPVSVDMRGDITITVVDPSGVLTQGSLKIRFK